MCAYWPTVNITFRADAGFSRDEILTWCEGQERINYVIGLSRNNRLSAAIKDAMEEAVAECEATNKAARRFCSFTYRTLKSWSQSRHVVAKAEALPPKDEPRTFEDLGKCNSRFVVTSLKKTEARALYEDVY